MRERCELRLTEAPAGLFQAYCNCGGWLPAITAPAAVMLNSWLDHLAAMNRVAYTVMDG